MNGLELGAALIMGLLQVVCASAIFVSLARPERVPLWLVQVPIRVRLCALFLLSLTSGAVLQWAGL